MVQQISRSSLEMVAFTQGHSRSQAKRIAKRIVALPDWERIRDVLTERFVFDYADPTAHEAIWNVLSELLVDNHAA